MELTREYFEQVIKGVATKDDLANLATKDDLLELATKGQIDTLTAKVEAIEEQVTRINTRTDEDTRAALKDIVTLKKRVTALEQH